MEKVCSCPISTLIVKRIQDLGRIEEKLKSILDDEIFDTLSKHNPYWESEHEVECDKLDETRMKLRCIQDNLWDMWSIIKVDEGD